MKFSARDLTQIALSVALIAVCAWISVPMAIPFTLQTFAVCLVAALLGTRSGLWAVAGYLLLGAAGVPVFSGFRGGPGALLGVTGGYLAGFLLTALVTGSGIRKFGFRFLPIVLSMAAGVLLCYAFGTAWFMFVYARETGPISLGSALSWCVIPYLIPDALKIGLAAALALRLRPLIRRV